MKGPLLATQASDVLPLIELVLALLLIGSAAGLVLKLVVAARGPHAVIDNILTRIVAWWLIAASVGLAFWLGTAGVHLLFAFASFVALREFVLVPDGRPGERIMVLASFFCILPTQYWLVWNGNVGFAVGTVVASCFVGLPLIAVLAGDARDLARRLWPLQWGLMLCVLGVSHAPALLSLSIPGHADRGAFLLMFLLLVSQLSDVLQYVWGKVAGRRLLAPGISPAKTVEGMVGGVLSATGLGAALAWITPFPPLQAALMAFGISLLGVLGGLTLSAFKRDRGIKDWGDMIPGHGGMLDRLDSLCFSAPAFYYALKIGWT